MKLSRADANAPAASLLAALAAGGALLCAGACAKTERSLREPPPAAARIDTITLSQLQPGPKLPVRQIKNP